MTQSKLMDIVDEEAARLSARLNSLDKDTQPEEILVVHAMLSAMTELRRQYLLGIIVHEELHQ
ncbi:MAG: hypothetical protein GY701_22875 [Sulfitobacter sp.]|nr:hypothetical protein [Sulfitobacter sp.]